MARSRSRSPVIASRGNGGSCSIVRRRWSDAKNFGKPKATLSQASKGFGRELSGSTEGRKPRSRSMRGGVMHGGIHKHPSPAWWCGVPFQVPHSWVISGYQNMTVRKWIELHETGYSERAQRDHCG